MEEERILDSQNRVDIFIHQEINPIIRSIPEEFSTGYISDRYHTFNELYDHRAKLTISLLLTSLKSRAWKSLLHNDGTMYPGMFIIGVDTKYGQATYHYNIDPYWSMTKGIRELDRAPKFDGHTSSEAIDRIYRECFDISSNPVFRKTSFDE